MVTDEAEQALEAENACLHRQVEPLTEQVAKALQRIAEREAKKDAPAPRRESPLPQV